MRISRNLILSMLFGSFGTVHLWSILCPFQSSILTKWGVGRMIPKSPWLSRCFNMFQSYFMVRVIHDIHDIHDMTSESCFPEEATPSSSTLHWVVAPPEWPGAARGIRNCCGPQGARMEPWNWWKLDIKYQLNLNQIYTTQVLSIYHNNL